MSEYNTLAREETATAPPTRWRNWWRLYPPTFVRCNTCGTFHHKGRALTVVDYDGCCKVYPSKDLAVSDASEEFDESCDQAKVEWLGAYPEGVRPSTEPSPRSNEASETGDKPNNFPGEK